MSRCPEDPLLDANVRALFADVGNEIFLSAASVWEMAFKASLGKLTLAAPLARLVAGGVERGIRLLAVTCEHTYQVDHGGAPGMTALRVKRSSLALPPPA